MFIFVFMQAASKIYPARWTRCFSLHPTISIEQSIPSGEMATIWEAFHPITATLLFVREPPFDRCQAEGIQDREHCNRLWTPGIIVMVSAYSVYSHLSTFLLFHGRSVLFCSATRSSFLCKDAEEQQNQKKIDKNYDIPPIGTSEFRRRCRQVADNDRLSGKQTAGVYCQM